MAGEVAEQLFLAHSSEQTQTSILGLFVPNQSKAVRFGEPVLTSSTTSLYTKPVKDMGRRGMTLYLTNQARRAVQTARSIRKGGEL